MLLRLLAMTALFLVPGSSWAGGQAAPVAEYNLNVSFDIPASKVSGAVTVPVGAGQELSLAAGRLRIVQATLNDKPVSFHLKEGTLTVRPAEGGALTIAYEGVFKGGETMGDKNYGVVSSTIDGRGISLTGLWYPQPEGLALYRLKALLPQGYEAISEAETITKTKKENAVEFTFSFDHPAEGLSLIATNRYEVTQERVNGVELFAYFFREDRDLARTYLQHAKRYIELYEKLLAPYPYKRFAVVENFLSTGYSLPTFTLLGQEVVKLPFIVETSLGHEVLHQWFGNSVYIEPDKGNWAEGLTTYLADQLYEEQKGTGWEYRKQLLVDYLAHVNGGNEFPLRDFRGRTGFSSRAIGYGKAAMVFHLLRKMLGDENFYAALKAFITEKQFHAASWDDLAVVFGKHAGKDLSVFFRQWIDEKGLPELRVENAAIRRSGSAFEVSFDAVQKGKVYALEVPITVSFVRGGEKRQILKLDSERKNISLLVDDEPSGFVIDRDYDLARKLTEQEAPPVIARLVGDEKPVIVRPVTNGGLYQTVIDHFKGKGAEEREAQSLKDAEVKASTLVILGGDNPLIKRLYGTVEVPAAGFSITVKENPWNTGKVAGIISAKSAEEAEAAFPKIFHYGKYMSLAFDGGKNIAKKTAPSERGILMELREGPAAIDLSTLKTLSDIIEKAAGKKIVYVGEYHDRFSHHNVELQVIKTLYKKNPKLVVGMEMFQRPFQKTLDDYISGAVDEREFLKQSEYFKRWGFDYNLYKPILDFARSEKLPVVALNLRREITEKVAKSGLDSLTDEEKKDLPAEMDFSDEDYRGRLKQIFEQHRSPEERNFDFFLQAQVLWDETMARSVDEYLKKNPDYQMVVIAGGGHLAYGAGIPKRAFRRNGFAYAVILNDADVERDIADYIVFPQPLDGVTAPRLMASLKEKDGRLVIEDFPRDSVSQKAGLKAGDRIIALDGAPVATMEDVKLALFYKKKDDTVRVKVARKRFLLGDREMELAVKL